jgi:hypothetical protein
MELKNAEVNEEKFNETEKFKEIKPQNGMNVEEAKEFWEKEFAVEPQFGANYNSYDECIKYTPCNSERGSYEGERGESKFIPSEATDEGRVVKAKLEEYGKDGIEYKNAEPDFSEVSECTVKIDNMTQNRYDYEDAEGNYCYGNFSQADQCCAEQWNENAKDGKTDWTAKDVSNYRADRGLTWHERCDTETMDLVPRDINTFFGHLGGCAECKARDAANGMSGGEFDE